MTELSEGRTNCCYASTEQFSAISWKEQETFIKQWRTRLNLVVYKLYHM